jgi:hypothetical protein
MKIYIISPSLSSKKDIADTLGALRFAGERSAKDPSYARRLLLATGMYTKSGKIKKQFR